MFVALRFIMFHEFCIVLRCVMIVFFSIYIFLLASENSRTGSSACG